jgi:CRISP-associated protein Cas1
LIPPALDFQGRRHREAGDVVNRALNYGYGVLLSRVWAAVRQARLEPNLGILHTGRRRTPALVFDLMEPFRQPVVDRAVLAMVGRGARLSVNVDGQLSMRSRRLIQNALQRRLMAIGRGRVTLDSALRRQAMAFRHALEHDRPMDAYRMPW